MINWNKPVKTSTGILSIVGLIVLIFGALNTYRVYPSLVDAGLYIAIENSSEWMIRLFTGIGANRRQLDRFLAKTVETNNLAQAEFALKSGADPNAKTPGNYPVLYAAVHYKNENMVRLLVKNGADMNYSTSTDWSILGAAIFDHSNKIARFLVESGADPDLPTRKIQRKPLWIAVKKKNMPMLKLLLEQGVQTPMQYKDEPGDRPYTLLHYALRYDNIEGAKLLIKGAGKGRRLPDDLLDGQPFISNFCLLDVQRALTRRKLETAAKSVPHPIVQAIETIEDDSAVAALINQFPDRINQADHRGVTPLIAAVENRRIDVAASQLSRNADPNQSDPDGIPPLGIALSLKEYDIAGQLIRAGANLGDSGCHGDSVFNYVITRNDIDALKLLIREKADLNRFDSPPGPPLVTAMSYGQERMEMTRLLLAAGADPYIPGDIGSGASYIRENPKFAEFKPYLTNSRRNGGNKARETSKPAFDCSKARNAAEALICSDKKLAEKDRILNKRYQSLLPHGFESLKQDQLKWLTRRDKCAHETGAAVAACLQRAYDQRIGQLDRLAGKVLAAGSSSWQKHFVNKLDDIPLNAFRAYYFDERTPGEVQSSEVVARPAVNFAHKDYFGIPGDHFGGYWTGFFTYKETSPSQIYMIKSRADAKVFIDGQQILQMPVKKEGIPVTFTAGTHKIEVLLVSDYFSVNFLMSILSPQAPVTDSSLLDAISGIENAQIWYCGAYESQNRDMSVTLSLSPSTAPIVLFLNSYQPIIWKFSDIGQSNLQMVVLSSRHQGSLIDNLPDHVKVARYDTLPYVYELMPKKNSGASRQSFKTLAYKIQAIAGKKPSGFSGQYGLTEVKVPEVLLDGKIYSKFGMRIDGQGKEISPNSGASIRTVFEE